MGRIFEMYASRMGLAGIAKQLNAEGIPSPGLPRIGLDRCGRDTASGRCCTTNGIVG